MRRLALASEILAPVSMASPGRVVIDGPSIDLSPRAALSLTMALSKLATNAVKYGTLSADDGKLSVLWQLRCIEMDLGGAFDLAFEP